MIKELPRVTVVTVTYNAEKFLEETIKSVVEQDYPNIEYIIIDGGSSDGTVEIIKKYESYLTYWISEPDRGIYDAMNKGIDAATGDWINFMNAGDSFCEQHMISKVMESLEVDTDLISGDIYFIDGERKTYAKSVGLEHIYDGMFCYHQTIFTKSHILKELYFDTKFCIAADYDFVLKCFNMGYKFHFIDMPIANFLEGGISETQKIKAKIEDMFIQSKYLENMEEIFEKASFLNFESFKPNHNQVFARLYNNLFQEMDAMNLGTKRFVLYGYGHIGKLLFEKFQHNIVQIVDQNFMKFKYKQVLIESPSTLFNKTFDFIIISALGKEKEITTYLVNELNISSEKILTFTLKLA